MTEPTGLLASYDPGTVVLPMSWEQYDSLEFDDDLRGAEYMDGVLVAPPGFPDRLHQKAIHYLTSVLEKVLEPDEDVIGGFGWHPEGSEEEFGPDVMVYPLPTDAKRFTGTPRLCIEVTSSNRQNDLIKKRSKYAAAGLPHYWVVDRQTQTLRCYHLQDSLLVEGDDHQRTTTGPEIVTARFGDRSVDLDLAQLFG